MEPDTRMGGPDGRFPETRPSVILGTRAVSYEAIVQAYWKPVYRYIRIKFGKSNEDAKDLTQSFFTAALDRDFAAQYEPAKGRFRTYLRTCLDRYLANQHKHEGRLRRSAPMVELDSEIPAEDAFEKECARNLFERAVEGLRESLGTRGRQTSFDIFARYDLASEHPTYEELAAEFGISAATVTNYLASARREFRKIVLELRRDAL
jgi:RNA polymerase sigma factor (sigma-70 family)